MMVILQKKFHRLSGSLTNLPKKKINNIFGGYTPKPL